MQSPLTPSGVEGRWQCRLLAVRVSSPRIATSARTLVHDAQKCPTGACSSQRQARSVFGTLTCHRDDTCASGRSVSFNAQPLWERQHVQVEGHNCSQRVMVPRRHFQAMRPSVSRRGQSPRYREYARHRWTYGRRRGECWDHGVDSQAGIPRKGDQPHNWAGRR